MERLIDKLEYFNNRRIVLAKCQKLNSDLTSYLIRLMVNEETSKKILYEPEIFSLKEELKELDKEKYRTARKNLEILLKIIRSIRG